MCLILFLLTSVRGSLYSQIERIKVSTPIFSEVLAKMAMIGTRVFGIGAPGVTNEKNSLKKPSSKMSPFEGEKTPRNTPRDASSPLKDNEVSGSQHLAKNRKRSAPFEGISKRPLSGWANPFEQKDLKA
jgi:hypothetical protein